jgi:hypothetical protein
MVGAQGGFAASATDPRFQAGLRVTPIDHRFRRDSTAANHRRDANWITLGMKRDGFRCRESRACVAAARRHIRYVVEGGHRLSGSIEPSGNKNAALPIIAAALLTDQPVHLSNVPRIRDTETLVDLIRSVGAEATWQGANELTIRARELRATDLDPDPVCTNPRLDPARGPMLARCGQLVLPPPAAT